MFDKHTIEELHKKTGYSMHYILDIRTGSRPPTDRFKILCGAVLEKPVHKLFNEEITNGTG